MILKQTTISLSLISSFLCLGMDNCMPDSKQEAKKRNQAIEKDFKTKWGYSIPTILIKETINNISKYKAVSAEYANNNDPLVKIEIQDIDNPLVIHAVSPQKITRDIQSVSHLSAEAQLLKKTIAEQELMYKESMAKNMLMKQQLTSLKKETLNIQKEITAHKKIIAQQKKIHL